LVQKIGTNHYGSNFAFIEEAGGEAELWKVSKASTLLYST
jgi:hypothetical protein